MSIIDLTYTQTKDLIGTLKDDFLIEDYKSVIEDLVSLEDDFYSPCETYRFINSDSIDEIMQDELSDDEHTLGWFDAHFISSIIEIDSNIIELIQEAGAYEAVGKLIIRLDKLEELQEKYARIDGYGHHFAHYDHMTNEICVLNELYYVFKVN